MIPVKDIEKFEKKINFKFKNKKNLISALIHPSYIKETKYDKKLLKNDFERLEFLGDRVLGLIISDLIFDNFKNYNEGSLTKKLSYLVQKEFLFKIALELNIKEILKYSQKKENSHTNKSILADSVESLIGSIYIDSGFAHSVKFIKKIWEPYLDIEASNQQDPKTKLQEISQHQYKSLPKYSLVKKQGPPHSPLFTISLKVMKLEEIRASAKSIRDAEKKAAKTALKKINEK